jgi:hypothetical protein
MAGFPTPRLCKGAGAIGAEIQRGVSTLGRCGCRRSVDVLLPATAPRVPADAPADDCGLAYLGAVIRGPTCHRWRITRSAECVRSWRTEALDVDSARRLID